MHERRESVAALAHFLDLAARNETAKSTHEDILEAYDLNPQGIQDAIPRDQFHNLTLAGVKQPSLGEISSAFYLAVASAPTSELNLAAVAVWGWAMTTQEGKEQTFWQTVRWARRLVQDYVVEGAPPKGRN